MTRRTATVGSAVPGELVGPRPRSPHPRWHVARETATAVVRRFGADRGAVLGAAMAFAALLSLLPLLLVLGSVLGLLAGRDGGLRRSVLHSALAQFPLLGTALHGHLHELESGSVVGLGVGIAWVAWWSLRVGRTAETVVLEVWRVPSESMRALPERLGRGAAAVAILGLGTVGSAALDGAVQFLNLGPAAAPIRVVATLALAVATSLAAFWVLCPLRVGWRRHLPGAVLAGTAWAVLVNAGTALVAHELRHLSDFYGAFAIVLGLAWWMSLAAVAAVAGLELNALLAERTGIIAPNAPAGSGLGSRARRGGRFAMPDRLPAPIGHVSDQPPGPPPERPRPAPSAGARRDAPLAPPSDSPRRSSAPGVRAPHQKRS